MANLLIKSSNVRGLRDDHKRREMFHLFHKSKYNIFLIQETHSTTDCEIQWRTEWGGDIYYSHGTNTARGTCILIEKSLGKQVHDVIVDAEGRYVILDIEIGNIRLTLASIYGPNLDDSDFFVDLAVLTENIENDNRIIGGDWNVVLNIEKDKKGGQAQTHSNSLQIIQTWMEETDLVDFWRLKNPNDFKFTWKRINPKPGIFCRLDYFLVSFGLIDKIMECSITPGYKTDHSAITLSLDVNDNKRGPGFWKLNTSYLNDPDYVQLIKNTIIQTVRDNEGANAKLLWDTMKCKIRGASIKFSSDKKKSKKNKIEIYEKKLKYFEQKISEENTQENINRIEEIKNELEKYTIEATKGAMIRSRARWCEEGEKHSKYFLNLEKRNHNNKTINKLQLENGNVITDSEEILNQQKLFYKKLYKTSYGDNTEEEIDQFVENLEIPKVSEDEKEKQKLNLLETELLTSLKALKNGRSPGIDGIPNEFYKVFWNDIKEYLIDAYNESKEDGALSFTQRQGQISLIPKKDRNPLLLKNWRPLSLLNSDYKILAKTIANRIKPCLEKIIHHDQTGFLQNRYIGENIVKALDLIEIAEAEDVEAFLMFIDFEKAYDHIEWPFLYKTLQLFGFDENLIKWVKILYSDITSCVTNNGWKSDFFQLTRGVRQGCPLSSYLFILCTEILSISIRSNPDIHGIEYNGTEHKLSQFADDTWFSLIYDQDNLNTVLQTLDTFQICSGLKINYEKTELLRIGSLKNSNARLYTQKQLQWTNKVVKLLGVQLTADRKQLLKLNYEPIITKLQNIISVWQQRKITLFGKISVIQSLLVSQLIYMFSVLPSPSREFLGAIEKTLVDYLWSNKKHHLSKETIKFSKEQGGLGMIDIFKKDISIKCAWVKRLLSQDNASWKKLVEFFIPESEKLVWAGNLNIKDAENVLKHDSSFWKNVLRAWALYNYHIPSNSREILAEQIWFNSNIKVKKTTVFYKELSQYGIRYIQDLINENYIFDCNHIMQKFGLPERSRMYVNMVIHAVPTEWKEIVKNNQINLDAPNNPTALEIATSKIKISKFIYSKIMQKSNVELIQKLIEKWTQDIPNINLEEVEFENFFQIIPKSIMSPKHRDFQFRLIHRVLVTNKSLKLWKIKESDRCTFCGLECETIKHILWDCMYVNRLWETLFNWITDKTNTTITFTVKDILLGITFEEMIAFNCIFIITKQYIYATKCLEQKPDFNQLLSKIQYQKNVEKYIATKNNKLQSYENKWSILE